MVFKVKIKTHIKKLSNVLACELPKDAILGSEVSIEYYSNELENYKYNDNIKKITCSCMDTSFRKNEQGLFICERCKKERLIK